LLPALYQPFCYQPQSNRFAASPKGKLTVPRFLLGLLVGCFDCGVGWSLVALVQNYMTPLLEAASYVSYEAAELLLKAKADPNVLDMNGMVGNHLWTYMSRFLDRSPSVATEVCASRAVGRFSAIQCTILVIQTVTGKFHSILPRLHTNKSTNQKRKQAPLHYAAAEGGISQKKAGDEEEERIKFCKLLLAANANPLSLCPSKEGPTRHATTPLDLASASGHQRVCALLRLVTSRFAPRHQLQVKSLVLHLATCVVSCG
jgi:hypothetical protein